MQDQARIHNWAEKAPDFEGAQNFESKDSFQHLYIQLYLYFCFG